MNPCSLTGHCLRGLSLIFYIPLLLYNLIQQPIIQQFTDARQINCCCTPHFIWMLKMARNINWATPALLLFGVEMRNYVVSWNWASQTSSTAPPQPEWLQTLGLIDSSPSNRCEHNFSVKMIILEFRTC